MVAALLSLGILVGLYYIYQQSGASSADAPGHCGCDTEESGMRLSYDELVQLAQQAGFGADSQTAAAIAMAESGGDASAYNPEKQACTPEGEGSFGLWQIYRKAHPEFACADLTDPAQNAAAAFRVYSEAGGFHPWSTFKSGVYQNFLA